jgi:CRP/FNR family transcriptional regulator, cyclic AMP receptor protein
MPANEAGRLEKFCSPQIFEPGETLFEEGHPITDIFLVQRGCAKFYKTSADKRHTVFSIFGEGDVFELMTADEKEIHFFSAKAITETIALSVSPRHFYQNFMSNLRFANQLLHQKIRNLKRFYFKQLAASEPVETRMAYFLLDLAQHPGMAHFEGKKLVFDVPLTRRDIAEIVNTSVETSIRIMRQWSQNGFITVSRRHLTIQNLPSFKKIIAELPLLSR